MVLENLCASVATLTMRRKRKFLVKFFLATSLVALLPFGVVRWQENRHRNAPKTPYTFPVPELAMLDKVVQARFAEMPTDNFGTDRVGKRHSVFVPKTASEKASVAALQRKGYEVVFYVAGERYFRYDYEHILRFNGLTIPFIQGPIFMTGKPPAGYEANPYFFFDENYGKELGKVPTGLPDGGKVGTASRLKAPAVKAFAAFKQREGMDFQIDDWKIAARAVRVSQKGCFGCHQVSVKHWYGSRWENPSIGDTLGVAMYAYRKKGKL